MVSISLGRTAKRHGAGWAIRVPSDGAAETGAAAGSVVLIVTLPGTADLYRNLCGVADEARGVWHLFWRTVVFLQLSAIAVLAVGDMYA